MLTPLRSVLSAIWLEVKDPFSSRSSKISTFLGPQESSHRSPGHNREKDHHIRYLEPENLAFHPQGPGKKNEIVVRAHSTNLAGSYDMFKWRTETWRVPKNFLTLRKGPGSPSARENSTPRGACRGNQWLSGASTGTDSRTC